MLEIVSLETVQAWIRLYGYWAVFLGIALENAGIPIPGETITLVGGFFAGSGELNYWLVMGCAFGGALLGDNCGYWIGKVGGWQFMVRVGKVFRVSEERLEEVREEFRKNARRAVFFGRFVALLRIFAGPMAGIAQMPYGEFLICNGLGAALWAAVTVSLSYFIGRVVPLPEMVSGFAKFGIVALLLMLLSVVVPHWLESRQRQEG